MKENYVAPRILPENFGASQITSSETPTLI